MTFGQEHVTCLDCKDFCVKKELKIFLYKKGTDSTQYAISFQWPWTCQIVNGSNYDTGSGHKQSLFELRISNVSK